MAADVINLTCLVESNIPPVKDYLILRLPSASKMSLLMEYLSG